MDMLYEKLKSLKGKKVVISTSNDVYKATLEDIGHAACRLRTGQIITLEAILEVHEQG